MQRHPRKPEIEANEQTSALPAFRQEMALVSDREYATRYAGQWVALAGDQVIATGQRPKEVLAEARIQGHPDPVLHYFPARDPDVVYWGGWP
jgi:hypothetical protein